jgi:hypothetical protein
MDHPRSGRLLSYFKRVRRVDHLASEEYNKLRQLAEAIIEYGRMHQSYYDSPAHILFVEAAELERRFRETPRAIEDALVLLTDMGRAEPADHAKLWKLKLGDTLSNRGEDAGAA